MRISRVLVVLLSLALLSAACQAGRIAPAEETVFPQMSAADEAAAQESLVTFFDKLAAGRYSEAVDYYGGSYDVLSGWNPNVDPADYPTLWRNGCSINGLNCLPARSVIVDGATDQGELSFTVEFATREGELFVLGPCCGVTETEQPPVSSFQIRVQRGEDGRFRVMDLPPYTP